MRDENHGRVERLQHALEPLERLDVEVVRGLVEQKEVGLRRERPRERGPRQLSARERRNGAIEVLVGEAETAHDGGRPVAPVVAPGVLEPGLGGRVAPERRRVVLAVRHPTLQRAQLLLDRGEVGGAGEHVLAQRPGALGGRSLVVQRDPRPALERQFAAIERHLPRERAQQRRLAGPIRAGKSHAVLALDLEGDAVEEDVARDLLAE